LPNRGFVELTFSGRHDFRWLALPIRDRGVKFICTKVLPVSQLWTATDATVLPVAVLCAVCVECLVSGRNVVWIIEIDRWVGGPGGVNETRSQHERRSGA
jgi:hypothetical protein